MLVIDKNYWTYFKNSFTVRVPDTGFIATGENGTDEFV